MNAQDFFSKAQTSAELAVRLDTNNQLPAALFYYREAASYLRYAADTVDEEAASKWRDKAMEYQDRSTSIEQQCE